MNQSTSHRSRVLLRFLASYAVWVALAILVIVATWNVYLMWREGMPDALGRLPRLITCLVLAIAVVLARWGVRHWLPAVVEKSKENLRRQVAEEMVGQTRDRAEDALQRGVDSVKGVYSNARDAVTGTLSDKMPAGARAVRQSWSAQDVEPASPHRCPTCGRRLRPGATYCDACGAVVSDTCPKCGAPLKGSKRFCRQCGASLGRH